jgi:hypothetical protein
MTYYFPPTRERREPVVGENGEKKSDCFSKGEDLLDGREKKKTNYLLGMATTDPHHHPMRNLHEQIVKVLTHP